MYTSPPISTLFPYTTLFRSCESTALTGHLYPTANRAHVGVILIPGLSPRRLLLGQSHHGLPCARRAAPWWERRVVVTSFRSEEHTSELQSRQYLVCRLLVEK